MNPNSLVCPTQFLNLDGQLLGEAANHYTNNAGHLSYIRGKGGYGFSSVCLSVCLFLCLSVSNITQTIVNELRWNIMEGSRVVKGTLVIRF